MFPRLPLRTMYQRTVALRLPAGWSAVISDVILYLVTIVLVCVHQAIAGLRAVLIPAVHFAHNARACAARCVASPPVPFA